LVSGGQVWSGWEGSGPGCGYQTATGRPPLIVSSRIGDQVARRYPRVRPGAAVNVATPELSAVQDQS